MARIARPGISHRQVLVHVGDWLQHQAALTGNDALQIGIWFDSDDEPEHLGEACQQFALIACKLFPPSPMGRGYSIGRLIRKISASLVSYVPLAMSWLIRSSSRNDVALTPSLRAKTSALRPFWTPRFVFSETYQGARIIPIPCFDAAFPEITPRQAAIQCGQRATLRLWMAQ